MKNIFLITLLSFCIFSCKNETAKKEAPAEADPTPAAVTLTDFPKSTEYADAKLESMSYKNGTFNFDYSGTDYKLGEQTPDAESIMCANSGKGQHIHLIIDNKPYAAKYTAEFEYEVEDGMHHILAFLSRSYHQSIKNGQAAIAQHVTVKDGSITKAEPINEPMLFYSRPKGTYTGKKDTEKVMLDFYMVNDAACTDCAVKIEVDGKEIATVKTWESRFIEGMGMGEHTVTLTLLDATGAVKETALNPVSRTFTLAADPAEGQK